MDIPQAGKRCKMAYEINPVEHGRILADIESLKKDAQQLNDRVDELERKAWKNDSEHETFRKMDSKIDSINESIKKIEKGTLVVSKKEASDNGMPFITQLFKNPQYLLWLILAVVVLAMVLTGYSFAEISQVLQRIK